jgi:hypothetical protein
MVINTHINQISDFDDNELEILKNDIKKIGGGDFYNVGTVPELLSVLNNSAGKCPVTLFTNFSPNYHFHHNGINVNDYQIQPLAHWRVEQYSFSAALYHHICIKYQILKVFFITSAQKRVVNDIDFGNITNGTPTSVKRKYSLQTSGVEYELSLRQYILKMTYDTIINTYSNPNHSRVLAHFPVVGFGRN